MEKLKQAIVVYIYTKDLEGKCNPVHSRMTENMVPYEMQSLHTLSNFSKSYFVWQQFINSLHLKVALFKKNRKKGRKSTKFMQHV